MSFLGVIVVENLHTYQGGVGGNFVRKFMCVVLYVVHDRGRAAATTLRTYPSTQVGAEFKNLALFIPTTVAVDTILCSPSTLP